jgi:hypothetical protein
MDTRLNFSYQEGAGIQYFIRNALAFTAEYPRHLVLNGGTAEPNKPLSGQNLLGISFLADDGQK